MKKFYYKNIFTYGSFQFSGHIEEYFGAHSLLCIILLLMPRQIGSEAYIRRYEKGILINEKKIQMPKSVILYYIVWYVRYLQIILTYIPKNEPLTVISFHPISFIGSSLLRRIRNVKFVYWMADYFPGSGFVNTCFRKIASFYNKRISNRLYLSDRLNAKMNGKLVSKQNIKTVMWGMGKPFLHVRHVTNPIKVCFIGEIRDSQGIEYLLSATSKNPHIFTKIIGKCPDELYKVYSNTIDTLNISSRVYFPNNSFYKTELAKQVEDCAIGIALYDSGPNENTYYADPAKIKMYAEFGLPIIMTNAADVARFVVQFKAGEVVDGTPQSVIGAITIIRKNYSKYLLGVSAFSEYFYFEKYYAKQLSFLSHL
jgi:hypothetical protein